jgi:predicted dienelactone hydrolase
MSRKVDFMPPSPLVRFCAALLLFLIPANVHAAPSVGFQHARTADGMQIGIWYPTEAEAAPQSIELYAQTVALDAPVSGRGLPLVVISHGTGASLASHFDTAIHLARSGFVVAALTHPGDNWRDRSRATQVAARPVALSATITHMLTQWTDRAAIDPDRIGAFGFSAGGFTVLAAAGGRPDLSRLGEHCRAHPAFYDCRLTAALGHADRPPARWRRDERIKALVVAAPALAFTFDRAGLAAVDLPVQVWAGGQDRTLPSPFYAEAIRDALPRAPDYRVEPGADHFDFLAPCSEALAAAAPPICGSPAGFDRAGFHMRFNAAVLAFFRANLPPNVSGRTSRRRRGRNG